MDTVTAHHARHLALLTVCGAGLVIAAAVYAALWTPGALDLSITNDVSGPSIVTWVAPNGPAWGAGVVPGDTIIAGVPRGGAPARLVAQQGDHRIVLGPSAMEVTPLDLLVAGLGLGLVLFGALVLKKGHDRRATVAFWRMSTLIGLALGIVPAGFHGMAWAIVLTFATLALSGPALLDLTLAFPNMGSALWSRPLIWAPALLLLLLYPVCWWSPTLFFSPLQDAADVALAGYILAAGARIMWVLRQPCSPLQQAQLWYLALGLVGGLLPLVALNLLPHVLVGHDLLPAQVCILALVLLPFSIGTAIVRTEFLGIPSLAQRRTLHVALSGALLVSVAVAAGFVAQVGTQRWGWPAAATAAGTSVLTGLAGIALWPWLTWQVDRLLLRDVYDTAETVLQLSTTLAQAGPEMIGPLVVAHLGHTLDLDFALLLTPRAQSVYSHPRHPIPAARLSVVGRRAQSIGTTIQVGESVVEHMQGERVLFLLLQDDPTGRVILCCGPKHSGACYTQQDRSLLRALGHHLTILFHDQEAQAQLAAQRTRLEALQGNSEPLKPEEMEILPYVARGFTSKEIGSKLNVHKRTVEKRLTAIYRKWGVTKRGDAVCIARQRGLLPADGLPIPDTVGAQALPPRTDVDRCAVLTRTESNEQHGQGGPRAEWTERGSG